MDPNRIVASRDILLEQDLGKLAWEAIAPLWRAVDLDAPPDVLAAQLRQMSPGQRALYAVDRCAKDVRNGGFEQFFWNRAGNLAVEALDGFRLIGAYRYADILEKAFTFFPDGAPARERRARVEQLQSLSGPDNDEEEARPTTFDELDEAFFRLLRNDDLEHYRGMYVRMHPDEFTDAG